MDRILYCKNCKNEEVFTLSGSGKHSTCLGCSSNNSDDGAFGPGSKLSEESKKLIEESFNLLPTERELHVI